MAEIGWISVHRKIRECIIWNDNEPFDRRSAWIDLLLMANHEDKRIIFNGEPITVRMGQRITSMRNLAERWHWSRDRVKRYLDLLEGEQMIVKECDTTKTLLTIVNYGKYQGECDTNEPPTSPPTSPPKSHQQVHRQGTNNNDNNENNENNDNKKHIYGEYSNVRLTDQEKEKLITDYGQQMTEDAIRFLDEHIEMKGYKAKSHYLCIRKWVVDAVKESNRKKKPVDLDKWWEGL